MVKIQTFENCKKKDVQLEANILTWLEEVRSGYNYQFLIESGREDLEMFGKITEGHYTKIKENSLPVMAPNFKFHTYKKNENAIESTGFLYFDIDNKPDFDIKSLNKDSIFSFYKSLSNKGWAILVRVDGITTTNFKYNYTQIAKKLGIEDVYDKQACSIDRVNVLSYDPDIFINVNSMPFKAEENQKVSLASNTTSRGRVLGANDTFLRSGKLPFYKIRLSNAIDFVNNPEANGTQTFDFKVATTEISFPRRKLQPGARNKVISTIFGQMLLLNPNIPDANAFRWLSGINQAFCEVPMQKDELIKIFVSNWKNAHSYALAGNRMRAVIFSSDCKLTKEEKQSVAAKHTAKIKVAKTKEKIYLCIEEWTSLDKISINSLAKETKISIPTIKRYYSEFKDLIKEKNRTTNEDRNTTKTKDLEGSEHNQVSRIDTGLQPICGARDDSKYFGPEVWQSNQTNWQTQRDDEPMAYKP